MTAAFEDNRSVEVIEAVDFGELVDEALRQLQLRGILLQDLKASRTVTLKVNTNELYPTPCETLQPIQITFTPLAHGFGLNMVWPYALDPHLTFVYSQGLVQELFQLFYKGVAPKALDMRLYPCHYSPEDRAHLS